MKTRIVCLALLMVLYGCQNNTNMDTEMTTTQNKELVAKFFELFSNGEIDDAFSMVSDTAVWWVPGDLPFSGTKSKTEYLQVVGAIQQGFPNGLQLNATSMVAEGDKVAVEVESYGEHANGRTYQNKYHFLITIENGQIIHVKEYMDTLHLYQLIQP